jgi:hypothetical protein
MNPGNSQNYVPASVVPAATDIIVTFAAVVGNGTNGALGALGFSVTFSDNPNAPSTNNFFNAVTGQSANWETFYTATDQGSGAADIKEVYHSVAGGASTGNGQVTVAKNINLINGVPVNPNLVANILTAFGMQSANPVGISLASNTGLVGVVDTYAIQAANQGLGGTASITSYTNSFYAAPVQTGIPEPMSFVLMGAGLVGIAVLRRRNG